MTNRQAFRQRKLEKERFAKARKAEDAYRRSLLSIARHIDQIVKDYGTENLVELNAVLRRYSDTLEPWARTVVKRMQAEIISRDTLAWIDMGNKIGKSLKREIASAPTGKMLQDKMDESVKLIKSLPIEASQRIGELALQGLVSGDRTSNIYKEIMRTGKVTAGRARTIARTQVGTTASLLTEVRARHIGSEGYFWRTSRDTDVRKEHKALEGKFIAWNRPPLVDRKSGRRAHAGQDINCRCYPEVAIPRSL